MSPKGRPESCRCFIRRLLDEPVPVNGRMKASALDKPGFRRAAQSGVQAAEAVLRGGVRCPLYRGVQPEWVSAQLAQHEQSILHVLLCLWIAPGSSPVLIVKGRQWHPGGILPNR